VPQDWTWTVFAKLRNERPLRTEFVRVGNPRDDAPRPYDPKSDGDESAQITFPSMRPRGPFSTLVKRDNELASISALFAGTGPVEVVSQRFYRSSTRIWNVGRHSATTVPKIPAISSVLGGLGRGKSRRGELKILIHSWNVGSIPTARTKPFFWPCPN
jgi:hypothetical protein